MPSSAKPPIRGTISGPPESPEHVSVVVPPAQTIVAGSKSAPQLGSGPAHVASATIGS